MCCLVIEFDAQFVRVEANLKGSPLHGLDVGVELTADLVVAVAEAFVVDHVFEASEGKDIFVLINGPESMCVFV